MDVIILFVLPPLYLVATNKTVCTESVNYPHPSLPICKNAWKLCACIYTFPRRCVWFCFQNPGTELEESYLSFVKLNLERFRAYLNDEKMKKQLIKVRLKLWVKINVKLEISSRRRGGLPVSTNEFGRDEVRVWVLAGRCVVFLGKTLYSHSAFLHPGVNGYQQTVREAWRNTEA